MIFMQIYDKGRIIKSYHWILDNPPPQEKCVGLTSIPLLIPFFAYIIEQNYRSESLHLLYHHNHPLSLSLSKSPTCHDKTLSICIMAKWVGFDNIIIYAMNSSRHLCWLKIEIFLKIIFICKVLFLIIFYIYIIILKKNIFFK